MALNEITLASQSRHDEGQTLKWPAPNDHAPTVTVRTLGVLMVVVIVGQRFALPIGDEGVSIVLVLALFVVLALVADGGLTHDLTRTILFLVAVAACGLTTWLHTLSGDAVSTNSFFLLLVVYLPWLFRVPDHHGRQAGARWLAKLYVRVMLAAAAVAVVEMAVQVLGVWTFIDPIQEHVPPQWLLANYNTNNPTEYASPIIKSQAFVFLEPSFLSQFLGLALIVAILRRAPLWQLGLLGLAMFCTYSGTGIVLVAVGLVIVLVRSPRSIRPSMVILGAAGVAALLLSSYAEPLLARTSEASDSSSSLSLRFIAPYQQVEAGLEQEPLRYLIGAGPGSSERVLESAREGSGLAVVYTIIPKLIFEYGLIAGTLFLAFIAVTLFRQSPGPVVPLALTVMLGLLSGSLLQPHTLLMAWLLSCAWGRSDEAG